MGDGRDIDAQPGAGAPARAGDRTGERAPAGASVWPAVRLVAAAAGGPITGLLALRVITGAMPAVELALLGVVVDAFASTGELPLGAALGLVLAFGATGFSAHVVDTFRLSLTVTPLLTRRHFELLGRASPHRFDDPEFLELAHQSGAGVAMQGTELVEALAAALRAGVGGITVLGVLGALDLRVVLLLAAAALPVLVIARLDGVDAARVWSGDNIEGRWRGYLGQLLRDPTAGGELRALGLVPHLLDRLRVLYTERARVLAAFAGRVRNRAVLTALVQSAAIAAGLALVAARAIRGEIGPGAVLVTAAGIGTLSSFLTELAKSAGELTTAAPYLRPLAELHREVERARPTGTALIPTGPIGIDMADVTFTFPASDHPVLERFSLTVEPGELLAVVGENGAGKSTLVRLAIGVLTPEAGEVLLSGVDARTVDRDALWRRIGFVPQSALRPEVTLREAVALGRPWEHSDDDAVVAALEQVGAGQLVGDVGLDGVLGRAWERGHDLSGGQWQRIALARMAYRKADLWLLDEPTANLDPAAEAEFVSGLRSLLGGATCVFVSHRFSTVRAADRLAVVDGGRVIELGSHRELVASGGRYARLFELQAAGYR